MVGELGVGFGVGGRFSGVRLLNYGYFGAFRIGHPILKILIFGGVRGGLRLGG